MPKLPFGGGSPGQGEAEPARPGDPKPIDARSQALALYQVSQAVGALCQLPFASGTLLAGVALPGLRGRVKSGETTATIELWNPADVLNFPVGITIEAAPTDGSTGAKRASIGPARVVSVNPVAGTVTATAAWDTLIPLIAVDDYLFGSNEFGPPTLHPTASRPPAAPPTYVSGGVVRLRHGLYRSTSAVQSKSIMAPGVCWNVLQTSGSQPAMLRRLYADREWLYLESRLATVVDLFVF